MESIGIRELRQSASSVLRRVAAGETVEVTDRGHPIARIVPLRRQRSLDQLITEGRASPADGDLLDIAPVKRARGERSLSDVLAEMRANER
ncbi:MAG: type II toxin-antitoxin system prevent-host-death family antitoxin [Candidatus Dormibacteraeota bacterium]|uniref:Antitoxin n=1 Tax=Candidatus Amunia macphersoniae TaxID=3127014 RepID=A0A934KMZ7_9BACT|nr:type II toxin-antitoxin system prevent-host-death family antitoxin [Candidatus Dormibacteraeota bacterium]